MVFNNSNNLIICNNKNKWLKLIANKYHNLNKDKWIKDLIMKLELFLLRFMFESSIFSVLIIIFIFIDNHLINDKNNNIIFVSLFVKVMNILIGSTFIMFSYSIGFEIVLI